MNPTNANAAAIAVDAMYDLNVSDLIRAMRYRPILRERLMHVINTAILYDKIDDAFDEEEQAGL